MVTMVQTDCIVAKHHGNGHVVVVVGILGVNFISVIHPWRRRLVADSSLSLNSFFCFLFSLLFLLLFLFSSFYGSLFLLVVLSVRPSVSLYSASNSGNCPWCFAPLFVMLSWQLSLCEWSRFPWQQPLVYNASYSELTHLDIRRCVNCVISMLGNGIPVRP